MTEIWQGKIRKTWEIACATCAAEDSATMNRKEDAIYRFRRLGWKHRRGMGWVCHWCIRDERRKE